MSKTLSIISEENQIRIDKFLANQFPDLTRSFIQKLFKESGITVNGSPVKASYKVMEMDEIVLMIPEVKEPEIVAEDIPIDILYEDDDLLVINKPKGMVVHPAPGHYTGTLVNAILFHCKDQLSGINGIARPGIVHRIDMDTTGSLVICKNDFAHQSLAAQLKEHSIHRVYYAIVFGNLVQDEGVINAPIGRHHHDRKKMCVNAKHSKEAITHYQVLKRFGQYTYVACKLETGRTHQIRVHMASIHHPILGDQLYGPQKQPFKLQGQTLHAKELGFIHPTKNEYMEFNAPLPKYFEELLQKLEK